MVSFIANCLKDRAPLVVNPPDLNRVISEISLNNIEFKKDVNILQEQDAMTLGWITSTLLSVFFVVFTEVFFRAFGAKGTLDSNIYVHVPIKNIYIYT